MSQSQTDLRVADQTSATGRGVDLSEKQPARKNQRAWVLLVSKDVGKTSFRTRSRKRQGDHAGRRGGAAGPCSTRSRQPVRTQRRAEPMRCETTRSVIAPAKGSGRSGNRPSRHGGRPRNRQLLVAGRMTPDPSRDRTPEPREGTAHTASQPRGMRSTRRSELVGQIEACRIQIQTDQGRLDCGRLEEASPCLPSGSGEA
jgi:hypothetical protein